MIAKPVDGCGAMPNVAWMDEYLWSWVYIHMYAFYVLFFFLYICVSVPVRTYYNRAYGSVQFCCCWQRKVTALHSAFVHFVVASVYAYVCMYSCLWVREYEHWLDLCCLCWGSCFVVVVIIFVIRFHLAAFVSILNL